jgi:hypothetical protein
MNSDKVVLGNVRFDSLNALYSVELFFISDRSKPFYIRVIVQKDKVLFDTITISEVIFQMKDYIESKSYSIERSMITIRSVVRMMTVGQISAIFRLYWDSEDCLLKKEAGDIIEKFLNSIQIRLLEHVSHPLGADYSNYLM